MEPFTGFLIPFDRPCVPPRVSDFVSQQAASGFLRVLGSVNDNATDEEFVKTWEECKGDAELAVESFVSQFPAEKKIEPVVEQPKQPEQVELPIDPPVEADNQTSKKK